MNYPLATKLACARRLTWLSYFFFMVTLLAGGFTAGTPATLVVIGALPLLLFLPGMARGNPRSLVLLCFVSLFYFTVLVTRVGRPYPSPYDILALTFIIILFNAAMFYSRWQQRQLAANRASAEHNAPKD